MTLEVFGRNILLQRLMLIKRMNEEVHQYILYGVNIPEAKADHQSNTEQIGHAERHKMLIFLRSRLDFYQH